MQDPAEIAEVGWFDSQALPQPITNLLRRAIGDVLDGARGVVRPPESR